MYITWCLLFPPGYLTNRRMCVFLPPVYIFHPVKVYRIDLIMLWVGRIIHSRMESNADFHEQLRLQQLAQEPEEEDSGLIYTDPKDGGQWVWDTVKQAWFPRITEDFIAAYQANYGFVEEPGEVKEKQDQKSKDDAEKAKADATTGLATKDPQLAKGKAEEEKKGKTEEVKKGKEKRKAETVWFDVEDDKNTNVYVTGLPEDITQEGFAEMMSKCGIILRDPETNGPRVKIYCGPDGKPKGDGLCCYLKRESVDLAMQLLDETPMQGGGILKVEPAKFSLKGNFDAKKRRKRTKEQKKRLQKQQRQLDWRPQKQHGSVSEEAESVGRKRHEKVVVLRNFFHPTDFEEDPLVLNEIQEDLRSECEKYGDVRKVIIFDRHPDGVASVSFGIVNQADICVAALNGRWFAGRQLQAALWDGVTDYQVEETAREREERLKTWGKFLGDSEKEEKPRESETAVTVQKEESGKDGEVKSIEEREDGEGTMESKNTNEERLEDK
uniref:17S U2 SnRNP complex component HTATSF1 n=1 Tax=Eptatretus burgeri TaxID=7764 RepID=A0A8C4N635_EPTBU